MGLREVKNTDTELWRQVEGDYYAPSIHVTEAGYIGIDVSGTVYVRSVHEWHALAAAQSAEIAKAKDPVTECVRCGAVTGPWHFDHRGEFIVCEKCTAKANIGKPLEK